MYSAAYRRLLSVNTNNEGPWQQTRSVKLTARFEARAKLADRYSISLGPDGRDSLAV